MWLNKPFAFIKKDFLIWRSYRLLPTLDIISVFIPICIFYFISQLFSVNSLYLDEFGGRYFPFVFIGLAVQGYLLSATRAFSFKLRQEQLMGTLESMLATPIDNSTLILGLVAWDFIIGWVNIIIYILLGGLFFGLHFNLAGLLPASIVFILGIISLSGLGIISAAFILYFKKGDPVLWLGATLSGFLSGVYFPVKIFPSGLQWVSIFIPQTYLLRALRLSLLKGCTFNLIKSDVVALILFCIILLPLSVLIFKIALKKTLRDGLQIY